MVFRAGRICFVFAAVLSGMTARAQTNEETNYWTSYLDQHTIEEISAHFLRSDVAWPRITTSPGLASKMLRKLREYERLMGSEVSDQSAIENLIPVYARLAEGFYSSGGYYNYVLLDVVNRFSLSRIAAFNERYPEKHRAVASWLNSLGFPRLNISSLSSLLKDEVKTTSFDANLNSVPEADVIARVFLLLDVKSGDIFYEFASPDANSTRMITDKNVPVLIWRMVETETVAIVSLPALLRFLQLGGEPEEIRLDDISRFVEVMGTQRDSFGSALVGVPRVYASHLKTIVDQFGSSWYESRFYKIAIQ